MKDEFFNELVESVKEAKAIYKGEREASRVTEIKEPDVVKIRKKHNLNQQEFAALLGISVGTLRNWEQGRRKPQGPARVLLKIAEHRPEVILESLS
ncbi:MAG: NadS family protein [Balneolales bacterium]